MTALYRLAIDRSTKTSLPNRHSTILVYLILIPLMRHKSGIHQLADPPESAFSEYPPILTKADSPASMN